MRIGRTGTLNTSSASRLAKSCQHEQRLRLPCQSARFRGLKRSCSGRCCNGNQAARRMSGICAFEAFERRLEVDVKRTLIIERHAALRCATLRHPYGVGKGPEMWAKTALEKFIFLPCACRSVAAYIVS